MYARGCELGEAVWARALSLAGASRRDHLTLRGFYLSDSDSNRAGQSCKRHRCESRSRASGVCVTDSRLPASFAAPAQLMSSRHAP